MYPKTRKEAREKGIEFYNTGKPCKHGHMADRITKRGQCVECRKIEWQVENERRKGLPKSEASKASGRRYYLKNRDKVIAAAVSRPEELKREYRKKWKERNPDATQVMINSRRKRMRDASPKWLNDEQRKSIRKIYKIARDMTKASGEKYVVDHIVPLLGETVCGLHVPWNLQVITHEANSRKSNNLLP